MTKSWRCFHCDEVFSDYHEAALHFGDGPSEEPACLVDPAEFRLMARELAAYREEDTALHREIVAMQSEISTRERRAEEVGYARGLADARKHPETIGLRPETIGLRRGAMACDFF